jgi:hypothetical protein
MKKRTFGDREKLFTGLSPDVRAQLIKRCDALKRSILWAAGDDTQTSEENAGAKPQTDLWRSGDNAEGRG